MILAENHQGRVSVQLQSDGKDVVVTITQDQNIIADAKLPVHEWIELCTGSLNYFGYAIREMKLSTNISIN